MTTDADHREREKMNANGSLRCGTLATAAIGLAALGLAATAALAPAPASAGTIHTHLLSFEPLIGAQTLSRPESVATDSNGNAYVVDVPERQISRWDAGGAPVNFSALGTNKISATTCPYGISINCLSFRPQVAVAPPGAAGGTAGDIYVTYKKSVGIFAPDGTPIGELTEAEGEAIELRGVAVDPAGNVYVADVGGERILRYAPVGDPVGDADFDAAITEVGRVRTLAVDSSGDVYVSTAADPEDPLNSLVVFKYPASQFGGPGAGTEIEAEGSGPGIDPTNDDLYIARPEQDDVAQYDSAGNLLTTFGSEFLEDPRGVAVDPEGFAFVANTNGFQPGEGFVSIFAPHLPAEAPVVSEERVTDVNTTNAILRAKLDPNRAQTTYRFQYTEHADFLANGFANARAVPVPDASAGSGNATLPIFQQLGGLDPHTTYDFRLLATNGTGTTAGAGSRFTTLAAAPSFGPCPNDTHRAGAAASLPDCRAYERVSPREKEGFDADGPVIASPQTDAVTYGSLGAFSGSAAGAYGSVYLGRRSPGGWGSESLVPPTDPVPELVVGKVMGASTDLSTQLLITNAKLTPEATGGLATAGNLYVHDSATDTYTFVGTSKAVAGGTQDLCQIICKAHFVGYGQGGGGSFAFTLASSSLPTSPEPPEGTGSSFEQKLYEVDAESGALRYVGIEPSEGKAVPAFGASAADVASNSAAYRPVSASGERIYWVKPSSGPIFLREGGETKTVSERESDETAQGALFWGSSREGELAFITSDEQLSEDASAAGSDLYRYDAEADSLEDLTPSEEAGGARVREVLGVSEDGSRAYFLAEGKLTEDAVAGQFNLYAWAEGTTTLVGTLGEKITVDYPTDYWRVSPNGRYLAFFYSGAVESAEEDFEGWPDRQAYLYDAQAEELSCVSCPPGGDSRGAASLHKISLPGEREVGIRSFRDSEVGLSRNLLDDGRFFFQSPERLVGADTNGKQDVYEYKDGETYLISSGSSDSDSWFGDATPDGSDVYFLTREPLADGDEDQLMDLYDARVGGGRDLAPPRPACEGDACLAPAVVPEEPDIASRAFVGPGNPPATRGCARIARRATALSRRARRIARRGSGRPAAKKMRRKSRRLARKARKLNRSAKRCRRAGRRAAR